MLEIRDLHVRYGSVEALHGISLKVEEGEIVTMLGANGAGKSTTLHAISGLIRPSAGEILLDGKPLHKLPAHQVLRAGVSQSPEGRRVFGTLTVRENIDLGAYTVADKAQIAKSRQWIYELFPRLAERQNQLAGTLSGGEQQMLAIGRAWMSRPRLLLLDEPSLGLAPLLVKAIFATIREINQSGLTVVLVEQNAQAALRLAHRGYVLEVGRITLSGPAKELLTNPQVRGAYLGGE